MTRTDVLLQPALTEYSQHGMLLAFSTKACLEIRSWCFFYTTHDARNIRCANFFRRVQNDEISFYTTRRTSFCGFAVHADGGSHQQRQFMDSDSVKLVSWHFTRLIYLPGIPSLLVLNCATEVRSWITCVRLFLRALFCPGASTSPRPFFIMLERLSLERT